MAKKIIGYIKLQLPAGKATPQPPVGPALGAYGLAIPNFTKEFNERTKNDIGLIIPVVITVYADRSFSFITKTPPGSSPYKEGLRHRELLPARLTRPRSLPSPRSRSARSQRQKCPTSTLSSVEAADEHDRRNSTFHGRYR